MNKIGGLNQNQCGDAIDNRLCHRKAEQKAPDTHETCQGHRQRNCYCNMHITHIQLPALTVAGLG